MSCRQTHSADKSRATLYEDVTVRIICELEQGIVPWVRPWGSGKEESAIGLPRNAATGRSYSGINILILWGRLFDAGYPSQHWLTFRQAAALGGTVRKGEHGVGICYADRFVPKDRRTQSQGNASSALGEASEPQAVAFLRRYTVFNIAQCDGLPDHCHGAPSPLPEREIMPEAEALARATLADIRHGGDEGLL
ncbi:DNA primase TraC [Bradyrhizobium ivorense]|uniref:DNA primase TraC n=1 Tax=Bradyrhizobium ivorense TaxID=2511166 RepID=A0A508TED6_9BRAD|nr:DNA primase TraC [Bradyrhizobium ivorense]